MATPSLKSLSMMTSTMLGFLSLQFILGVLSALYVTFPDTTDQKTLMDFANQHWQTMSHFILGIILVLFGLWILIQAIRRKQKPFGIVATIAFIMVLVAGYGGDQFVRTQNDAYSVVMAVAFIIAMGLYGRLLAALMVAQAKGE